MMPVSKYVDMDHVDFKQAFDRKGEIGLWELLNYDLRILVMTEYIGDRIDAAMYKMGLGLTSGINAAVKDALAKNKDDPSGLGKSGPSSSVHNPSGTKPDGGKS